jgi:hypothetical protein
MHFVVFRFFIIMTCYFPRIVPPLVLHSHLPTMCWYDECDPHRCSFKHCLTLYTIFCYAAFLLCHHHMPLPVGNEFHCRKCVLPTKSKHTTDFFVVPGFQFYSHCTSTYPLNSIWLTDSCISIECYPYYKCCLLPRNKMVVWQKHYRLENVTYWPCLAWQVYWGPTLKVFSKISLQCILVKNSPYFMRKLYWTYHIS